MIINYRKEKLIFTNQRLSTFRPCSQLMLAPIFQWTFPFYLNVNWNVYDFVLSISQSCTLVCISNLIRCTPEQDALDTQVESVNASSFQVPLELHQCTVELSNSELLLVLSWWWSSALSSPSLRPKKPDRFYEKESFFDHRRKRRRTRELAPKGKVLRCRHRHALTTGGWQTPGGVGGG